MATRIRTSPTLCQKRLELEQTAPTQPRHKSESEWQPTGSWKSSTTVRECPLYAERLAQYFVANDVTDDKKRAIFLSVCGRSTYHLVHNLSAPDKPSDKSFTDLCALLVGHYSPTPSAIVQRFKFHTRVAADRNARDAMPTATRHLSAVSRRPLAIRVERQATSRRHATLQPSQNGHSTKSPMRVTSMTSQFTSSLNQVHCDFN